MYSLGEPYITNVGLAFGSSETASVTPVSRKNCERVARSDSYTCFVRSFVILVSNVISPNVQTLGSANSFISARSASFEHNAASRPKMVQSTSKLAIPDNIRKCGIEN